jgi:ATP-dependent protease ClpP protease subunit
MSDATRRGRDTKEKNKEPRELPVWGSNGQEGDGDIRVVGNHIYYYADIDTKPVAILIDSLHTLANKQRAQAIESGNDKVQPIKLHLNSPGGGIFSGIAAMEAVRKCPVPVHAVIDGMCASAATFPLMVAEKRFMNANSYILIHQLSGWAYGKYEELLDEMKNKASYMHLIRELYLKYTKIKQRKLDKMLKHDIWFNADKALKLGMVDEII